MPKPYTLSGEPTAQTVEQIDEMLGLLFQEVDTAQHAMLSSKHSDVTAAAVARGALIVGQGSTATWQKLVIGAAARVLRSDGTDLAWAQVVLTTDVTGVLPVANGGTNIASYAVGDLLYASGATTLSKLADVATGNALISGGVTTAPSWGKIGLTTHVSGTLPVANGGTGLTTIGTAELLYGSSPGVYDVVAKSTSNSRYLSNQGVNNYPTWDTVNLSNGVSSTLPVANGGTNRSSYSQGDLLYASGATAFALLNKDANATRYLSNTGASNNPAWAQIDLSNGVTGDLPYANLTPSSAASKVLGRTSASAGDWQEITLGPGLTMTLTTLDVTGGSGLTHPQVLARVSFRG